MPARSLRARSQIVVRTDQWLITIGTYLVRLAIFILAVQS